MYDKKVIDLSDNRAVGVFDSGLGGLTCAAELMKLLPREHIIYFGDTARVPYGTRSRETILEYARQDIAFMKRHNVKMIIAACGTVSSAVLGMEAPAGDTPFSGVVEPAARAAAGLTKNGIIGITGTPATIGTAAYERALSSIAPDVRTVNAACGLFVPLVENGFTDRDDLIVKECVKRYLAPIKESGADTLILGCTHYPHLAQAISDYMGEGVRLVSSGAAAAVQAAEHLRAYDMFTDNTDKQPLECYTTDSEELFSANAGKFLGSGIDYTVRRAPVEEIIKGVSA